MIESVIQHVTEAAVPGSGDNLLGFRIDAQELLGRADWLGEFTTRSGTSPTCMIEAEGVLANGVDSLQTLAGHLKRLWNVLAHKSFEASKIEWYQAATVLRFVTVSTRGGYYVTGRVRVSGGPYAKLAEVFERRFHVLGEEPRSGEQA